MQKLAEAYSNVSFATLYGNANEDLKHVFRDRLGTKVTPTFFFYRNGALQPSLHANEACHLYTASCPCASLDSKYTMDWLLDKNVM